MRYILEDLVDIRVLRESRAAQAAAAQRIALEQALDYVEKCKADLESYRLWRVEERRRIYDSVIRKEVNRRELDALKEGLAALDEKETLLIQQIISANKAADEARSAYEDSREAWRKAQNNLSKLEDHREVWLEEVLAEENRKEDLESEEFGVKRLGDVGEELEY